MQKLVLVLLLAAAAVQVAQASGARDLLGRQHRCKAESQMMCGGHCRSIFTDPKHCGKCWHKCGHGFECRQGGCVCPRRTPDLCDKRCTSTERDPFNCGFCGNVCPSGKCIDGACLGGDDGCPRYEKRCRGRCMNVMTDTRNCGDCGVRCPEGFTCQHGGCVCPRDRPDQCGRPARCTDKRWDNNNCGFCGNRCRDGQRCHKGECIRKTRMVYDAKKKRG